MTAWQGRLRHGEGGKCLQFGIGETIFKPAGGNFNSTVLKCGV